MVGWLDGWITKTISLPQDVRSILRSEYLELKLSRQFNITYLWEMVEIVNRVKESGLTAIDLADFKPTVSIMEVDIAQQLWQRLVLKERDFRAWVKSTDWSQFMGSAVYIHCSVDAIIPTWAYMLIGSKLVSQDITFVVGSQIELEKKLIADRIKSEPLEDYIDSRIIIKGCADVRTPEYAMTCLVQHLQPVVKSIMYGEPCSTVPVFKRPK